MAGVASLALILPGLLAAQLAKMPQPVPLPVPLLVVLSLIQPSLLLAGAVALGAALAPPLGLRSHIAEKAAEGKPFWPSVRRELPAAAIAGIASFLVIVALEAAFRPWMGESGQTLSGAAPGAPLAAALAGVLYGGITEELLLRWGVLSLLAWLGWRWLQRTGGPPRASLLWAAIFLSALLFGAGHLPATAALVPLTPFLVARALLLNGIFGVVAGWLFWRHSLEAAMVAHATFHVASALAALAGLRLSSLSS